MKLIAQGLPKLSIIRNCLLLVLSLCYFSLAQASIPESERAVLINLFNLTNGASWLDKTGWLGAEGTECQWHGVSCETINGADSVVQLSLPANGLQGPIPLNIDQLPNLKVLDLSQNRLNGVLPESITRLKNLTDLALSDNQLSGIIPPSLGQLSQLKVLSLDVNQLSGVIPASIGQLANLATLSIAANQLNGLIPAELMQLSKLEFLILAANKFSGTIPDNINQLTNLKILYLSQNQFTGAIPANLGLLTQLIWLSLDSNQLSGAIPPAIGQLLNLQTLYLNDNQLNGPIPETLLNLSLLQILALQHNCLATSNAALISFIQKLDPNWVNQRENCSLDGNPPVMTDPKPKPPIPTEASASFVEPNNTPEQAVPILVNDSPTHQLLTTVDDVDWYEFYAQAGKRYTIEIPEQTIGAAINPAIQLYDASGNALTSLITRSTLSMGIHISGTAPASGLFRIKVSNQGAFARTSDAGDFAYQIRVYLTDAPQQGLIKGKVINSCTQTGINKAEVIALLGIGVSDSTLTHKTGEFGLLLNPDTYQLKSQAANFVESGQMVAVDQLDNNEVQLLQAPHVACQDYVKPSSDPWLEEQRAVAVYSAADGLLIVRDVWSGDYVYYAELQNIGDFRFQLIRALRIPGTIHSQPADYNYTPMIANLPSVFALGKTWKVVMKNQGDWLFTLEKVE